MKIRKGMAACACSLSPKQMFFFYLYICLRSARKSAESFVLWDPKNCSGSAFDPILSVTHQESYLCPSFWGEADGKEREGF